MKIRSSIAASCFFIVASVACSIPALAAIDPGDTISVHVYNHPELSSDLYHVDAAGVLAIPVIGDTQVAGLTPEQVAYILKNKLKNYVRYPAVDVRDLSGSTSIFVAGGPGGVLVYAPGETLGTAIADVEKELQKNQTVASAASTNITDELDRSRIDIKRVVVMRSGQRLGVFDMLLLRKTGDPGPVLYPNDTISFADKPVMVNVRGDVGSPGKAYLWEDEPLSDAVAQAGGLMPSAAIGNIELDTPDQAPRLVAYGDPVFSHDAEAGDLIIVPTAPRVTVAGMVYQPGITTLKNNFTLLSAMYSAGGISKWANIKDVQVTDNGVTKHYDVTRLTHGDQTQNPELHDGDTVFVPEGHKIDFTEAFAALFGAGSLAADIAR